MNGPVGRLIGHRELLKNLLLRDIRAKYKGSVFGALWTIINPLIMLLLYTYVFSIVLGVKWNTGQDTISFVMYLFCGLFPWMAFQEAISRSTNSIVENGSLLKSYPFPAKLLPFQIVISSMLNQLIGFAILIVVMLIVHLPFTKMFLLIPIVLLIQFAFTLGLAWFFSSINVFFRDISSSLGIILLMWMFATPIFYPESIVPENLKFIITINPLAHIVEAYRNLLLEGKCLQTQRVVILLISSIVSLAAGYGLFNRTQQRFTDYV